MNKKLFLTIFFLLSSNITKSEIISDISKILDMNLEKKVINQLKSNLHPSIIENKFLYSTLIKKHNKNIKNTIIDISKRFKLTKNDLYKIFLGITIEENKIKIIKHNFLDIFLYELACYCQDPQNLKYFNSPEISNFIKKEKINIKIFFTDEYDTANSNIENIFINEKFWNTLSTEEKLAITAHEISHIQNNDTLKIILSYVIQKAGIITEENFYNYCKELEENADIQAANKLKSTSGLILFIKKTTKDKFHPNPNERINYLQKICFTKQ